jgi:hypothetical protein
MKLQIYYRHTPPSRTSASGRPEWFSHKLCFANLLQTLTADTSGVEPRLTVLFDGSDRDLAADFAPQYLAAIANTELGRTARVQRFDGGSQWAAWSACRELAMNDLRAGVQDGDLLYFLENDYLHRPGWLRHLADFAKADITWDYLTLYDHPDLYTDAYRRWKSKVVVAGQWHWRTMPSTCWTFIMRKETLARDHRLFSIPLHDHHNFFLLTRVLRRRLFTPLPGLSTHCAEPYLSPGVDWAALAEETAASDRVVP